jgi:hypothetical protein
MMEIDPAIETAVQRMMVCAPVDCPREIDCFRVARWARDQMRRQRGDSVPTVPPLVRDYHGA